MTAERSNVVSLLGRKAEGEDSQDRLVDAAVGIVGRTFDVPRSTALAALRDASRTSARTVYDVAAGLVLSDHLPPSLVARLRHGNPEARAAR